jgi:hypothetical protein
MSPQDALRDIVDAVKALPASRLAELRDFAVFLRQQCEPATPVDDSDFWTEEDIRDLTAAVLERAEGIMPGG